MEQTRRFLLLGCAFAGAMLLGPTRLDAATGDAPLRAVGLDPFSQRVLAIHNQERRKYAYPALVWDPLLAQKASAYAQHLARTGRLVHSPKSSRGKVRENLSQGLSDWGPDQMVGSWLNERRHFRAGLFPNVSATGNWYDVSHYSQMIWPLTARIGCGVARGHGFNWLVCHYDPGGNSDGVALGLVASSN